MLKIEKFVTASPEQMEIIIEGMRNPMNSWDRSDSFTCCDEELTLEELEEKCGNCPKTNACDIYDFRDHYILGENDHGLMMSLAKGGPVHAKYRRMMPVWVTIDAPLYWWKEFDTYKVGTVANSCSTMHKIHAKEFTIDDFSCDHLIDGPLNMSDMNAFEEMAADVDGYFGAVDNDTGYLAIANQIDKDHRVTNYYSPKNVLETLIIPVLNANREAFLKAKKKPMKDESERAGLVKKYWWQMIQLLPSSYNQKRTVFINYEVLFNAYHSRKNHKLDEWHVFCDWVKELPYSEIITMEE